MATTPRAGIINLNFKDVSQMAQNIADNDPWKLGIETAGKVLTDREKYILYQRALADVEGRDRPEDKTAGELISSGISKAGEKAGDAFSWLGEKAGKGIDKLRALMPSETIEKSYEQGEKTESPIFQGEMSKEDPFAESMSRADGSSEPSMTKLQAPAESGINVSFPTTVVGKDKVAEPERKEYGDKVDWNFPNKGYETEFPTTVVGAPEGTKAPSYIPFKTLEALKQDNSTQKPTQEPASEVAPDNSPENTQKPASPFGGTEVAETKIKAPRMTGMEAWSEMNRLDPQRAAFDYNRVKTEADKKKVEKEKTQSLLKEVASDFANFDPTDQTSWTDARNRWLEINPNLSGFIPEQASQDAWDRIQTQGGLGKNVAPKGEFAQRKYLEDQVKQATFLSTTARASGKYDEADFYANKALTIQKQLDGRTGETGETVDQILLKYKEDIDALLKATTKDDKADTSVLFAKISGYLGEGTKLTAVEAAIDKKLEDKRAGRSTATDYEDGEQQKIAAIYDDLAKVLSENKAKVRSAISLIKKKIPAGGARIAAKTLQGDVLAESEFSSYKNSNPLNQALSNWANKFAGVSFISEQDAQNLVDALIETYNASAGDYLKALKNNKYKDDTVELLSAQRIFGTGGGTVDRKKYPKQDKKGNYYRVANGQRIYYPN